MSYSSVSCLFCLFFFFLVAGSASPHLPHHIAPVVAGVYVGKEIIIPLPGVAINGYRAMESRVVCMHAYVEGCPDTPEPMQATDINRPQTSADQDV